MKNITQLTVLIAFFALASCSKEDSVAPKSPESVQTFANGTLPAWQGTEFSFPGLGATYNNFSVNLTNLLAPVPMIRKNYLEQANGGKITTNWSSVTPLNPAVYANKTLPYSHKGFFSDQDPKTTGYIFEVSFSIDKFGIATATLQWNGAYDKDVRAYYGL